MTGFFCHCLLPDPSPLWAVHFGEKTHVGHVETQYLESFYQFYQFFVIAKVLENARKIADTSLQQVIVVYLTSLMYTFGLLSPGDYKVCDPALVTSKPKLYKNLARNCTFKPVYSKIVSRVCSSASTSLLLALVQLSNPLSTWIPLIRQHHLQRLL